MLTALSNITITSIDCVIACLRMGRLTAASRFLSLRSSFLMQCHFTKTNTRSSICFKMIFPKIKARVIFHPRNRPFFFSFELANHPLEASATADTISCLHHFILAASAEELLHIRPDRRSPPRGCDPLDAPQLLPVY